MFNVRKGGKIVIVILSWYTVKSAMPLSPLEIIQVLFEDNLAILGPVFF